MLNEIVRQTFDNKIEFQEFVDSSNKRLAELSDPASVPQLSKISERLTSSIGRYYSDTGLVADLNKANEIAISFPTPLITVIHRGLKVDVDFVGHGLQRAIFFSLVQFLAEEQAEQNSDDQTASEFPEAQSDIILLIEEPEIYQHPLKQILFYEAFKEISEGFNRISGIRIQIIFATHSEKFVSMRDIDKVRIITNKRQEDKYVSFVKSLSLDEFSNGMASALGAQKPMSKEAFSAGLHIFNREVSEGFFADKIILVEGISDKAILEGVFFRAGTSAHREGISIIDVGGKTKIDKPLYAFRALGIPVYVVFDNDQTSKKCKDSISSAKRNKLIQIICGKEILEDFPVGVHENHFCFDGNLENYLQLILGDSYQSIRDEMASNFELGAGDVVKTPAVVSALMTKANSLGHKFQELDDLIEMARKLK